MSTEDPTNKRPEDTSGRPPTLGEETRNQERRDAKAEAFWSAQRKARSQPEAQSKVPNTRPDDHAIQKVDTSAGVSSTTPTTGSVDATFSADANDRLLASADLSRKERREIDAARANPARRAAATAPQSTVAVETEGKSAKALTVDKSAPAPTGGILKRVFGKPQDKPKKRRSPKKAPITADPVTNASTTDAAATDAATRTDSQAQSTKPQSAHPQNNQPESNQPGKTKPGKPKRVRTKRASAGTRAGFRPFRELRRAFYGLATAIFAFAAMISVYFAGEPWISAWLDDSAPDVTIPSIDTLKNLSASERDLLSDDALRMARFRAQRVINEPLPTTIDSRPEEIGTFPLNARNRSIEVEGIARRFRLPDNREFLRFTDFDITPGYELALALSPDPDPRTAEQLRASGYLEFAELKADVGSQNYLLPTTFSIDDFDSLVIFDRIFGTVYANARLR